MGAMGGITFPKIYNTYFVAFVATVGGMLFGFDISSMSAIIGTEQYNNFFNKPAGVTQGACSGIGRRIDYGWTHQRQNWSSGLNLLCLLMVSHLLPSATCEHIGGAWCSESSALHRIF